MTHSTPSLPSSVRARARPRGVALLMVLATLLVVVVAGSIVATAGATERASRRAESDAMLADDLAEAALAPAHSWLEQIVDAGKAVLPPDSEFPMIAVLDDALLVGDGSLPVRVRISAWDQRGMVPWQLASGNDGIAKTLPEEVRHCMEQVQLPRDGVPGLDLISSAVAPEAFPLPVESSPRWREMAGSDAHASGEQSSNKSPDNTWPRWLSRLDADGVAATPPIGALVATHTDGAFLLNVNTAPRALLEAAAAESQLTLPDSIWESRAAGKPVTGGLPARPRNTNPGDDRAAFVTASDRWSMRIDAIAGRSTSSWWVVFARTDRDGWKPAQRLRISSESLEWPASN